MDPINFKTKDGRQACVRLVREQDAAAMVALMQRTSAETRFLGYEPGEFPYTPDSEADFIAKALDDPFHIFLIAEVEDQLAGQLQIKAMNARRRFAHRAGLGMVIYEAYWGQGLGTVLMQAGLDAAREHGMEQVQLEVVSTNWRGFALYQRFGFLVYGTRHRAIKYADGSYADEYLMQLIL